MNDHWPSGQAATAKRFSPTPINDVQLGSLRPQFSWTESTSPNGPVSYQLQYSLHPRFPRGKTISVITSSPAYQPSQDLPVSTTPPIGARYYWRVRACSGKSCSAFSATRWLNLGRATKDLNGDGFADILVGAPDYSEREHGRIRYYFGGATFDAESDGMFVGRVETWNAGIALAAVDLNGDGYSDVAYGMRGLNEHGGVDIFLSGPDGFNSTPISLRSKRQGAPAELGWSLAPGGDVNGDGYSDLIVGEGGYPFDDEFLPGYAHVLLGGPNFDGADEIELAGETSFDQFGTSVAAADVNGDGFSDVIAGAPERAGGGAAYVFFGGRAGPDTLPDATLTVAGSTQLGEHVSSAGDFNGDGYGDFLISDPPAQVVHLYLGGPGAFDSQPDATFSGTGDFGASLGLGGDIDADGFSDILIGAPGLGSGVAFIYAGSESPDTSEDGQLSSGYWIGWSDDLNGDGMIDFVVSRDPSLNEVLVTLGNGTFSPASFLTLTGEGAESFGYRVF